MTSETISLIIGTVGAISTVGCLFYAWKNSQILIFLPRDKEVISALSGNVNKEGFVKDLHSVLERRVNNKRQLRAAFSIAKQMHFAKPIDEALIEIHKRALELNDLKFAYEVATAAQFAVALDQMLGEIVDAALTKGDKKFANKAANRMHFAINYDESKKKIMASYGVNI